MKSQKQILFIRRGVAYIVLAFLMFVSLFPFVILMINSTRLHAQIMKGFSLIPGPYFLRNLKSLMGNENIPVLLALGNSVFVSLFNAAFATYFSAMTAYGFHMYRFKGKSVAFKFIMAVMMVPTQVSTLGFIRLLTKLHLMDSYVSLIVPSIAAPVVFFYMYQSMEATLPYSIVEAARVDGCNEFRTFNQIVVPMMKPAFAVQAIFSFVSSWNNYFVPQLVLTKKTLWTVPIVIANARNADYMNNDQGINYMLMTLAIIPLMIIYFCLSKYIIAGATAGGVKE